MDAVYWEMIEAIASIVSSVAIVAGTVFVVIEVRQAVKDRYLNVSSGLFQIWHSAEFQDEQLFLLHKLPASSYAEFIKDGRGGPAERAIHRVGGFYDHVGHLILSKIIKQEEILPTIGGDAIRVWQRIEPLVREARKVENAMLFQHYEAVLPNCLECYVPLIAAVPKVEEVERIEPKALLDLIQNNSVAVLDVSKQSAPRRIRHALRAEPNDLSGWLKVLPPGKSVATYCT